MQNAMNNMMNNSNGNQPLSVCNQTPPLDSGSGSSSRSPSASPRSNRSESSPAPELLVTMDTSLSSDSSSSTDSGEEEVIGTVTRAHQETFMYNQEQGNVPSEAPKNYSHCTGEERQEVWNHQINASSLTNQKPLSGSVAQGHEDSSQECSTLSGCPVRMANSSPAGPSLHNLSLRAQNDMHANGSCSVPMMHMSRCARGNRMHLVSETGLS